VSFLLERLVREAAVTAGIMTARQPERDAVGARDALRRFGARDPAPDIAFPPDGAEVWAEDQQRSLVPGAHGCASGRSEVARLHPTVQDIKARRLPTAADAPTA